MTDDVLLGVRQAREAFAAAHGYDLRAMAAALRQLDADDDRPVVRLPPRPPEPGVTPMRGGHASDAPRLAATSVVGQGG